MEYGDPVEVGGLKIQPGDLIHGDRHGIINVPKDLATQLPPVAAKVAEQKQQVIELSRNPGASFDELGRALRELLEFNMDHPIDGENQWKQR